MKKTFLLSAACMIVANTFAQIPNNSFENWTTVGTYINPDGWGTMNNTTAPSGSYTATKGTPGNPGAAYLKLTSTLIGSVVVNGIAVSGQLDSVTMQPKSGFAFTQRPANFIGRWQHMIYGTSQGSLFAQLTRWDTGLNQRVTVATASITLSGMAMSWANFSLPFNYLDGAYPDTCVIVLKASGSNPTNLDYLWVDNLGFSGSVTGVNEHQATTSAINVYPNPSHGQITIHVTSVSGQNNLEIVDLTGKVICSQIMDSLNGRSVYSLNTSSFTKGIYFVKVKTAAGVETKKISVE